MMTDTSRPSQPSWKVVLWTAAAILSLTALFVVARDAGDKRTRLAAAPQAATATQGWREVGRWRGAGVMPTEHFTVRGPWRIRWKLDNAREPFRWMLLVGKETESRLLEGEPGETVGVRVYQRGDTYRLMFHNTVGYEVVVEEESNAR